MRFKRIICLGGVWLILAALCSLSAVHEVRAQCTPTGNSLQIGGASPQMSCGGSQNLSASGGCPPYEWGLSGGGTLTPSGGDNTTATYYAPGSNANCGNDAMVTLTDCCKNTACIQLAVNCYTGADIAFTDCEVVVEVGCHKMGDETCCSTINWYRNSYRCDGTLVTHWVHPQSGWPCWGCAPIDQATLNCYTRGCGQGGPGAVCDSCCVDCTFLCYILWGENCGLNDKRTETLKAAGCCPAELPDEEEDCENEAKNAGPPKQCERPDQSVGNPINVATGNKYEGVLDLRVSTPGIPLEFRRSYNSKVIFNSPLGYGWTHTYDLILV